MNHRALLRLIEVACDHWRNYNDATQRLLLSSIFWVAGFVADDLEARSDHQTYEHAISEIRLMQDFSETGLKDSDFATAFSQIGDAVPRAIPLPED